MFTENLFAIVENPWWDGGNEGPGELDTALSKFGYYFGIIWQRENGDMRHFFEGFGKGRLGGGTGDQGVMVNWTLPFNQKSKNPSKQIYLGNKK